MLIEASLTAGVRPTTMIWGADSRKPYGSWDRLLVEAYQIVKNEQCPQCHLPKWMCHSDDGDIGFDRVEEICYATRERESLEADDSNKSEKDRWGIASRMEPRRYSGKPLDGAFREAYYRARWQELHPDEEMPAF